MDDDAIDAPTPSPDELRGLVRAAMAYARRTQAPVAKAIGIPLRTLQDQLSGTKGLSLDVAYRIADVCGVPRMFMRVGFRGMRIAVLAADLTAKERADVVDRMLDSIVPDILAAVRDAPKRPTS